MNTKIHNTLDDFFTSFVRYMQCVSERGKILKEAEILFMKMAIEYETIKYLTMKTNLVEDKLLLHFDVDLTVLNETSESTAKIMKYFCDKYSDQFYGHLKLVLV